MRTMRILLSSVEERAVIIYVVKSPIGETPAQRIDFTHLINRRSTLLKSLSAISFCQEDFPDQEEKDWMKREGLLNEGGGDFHGDLLKKIGRIFYDTLFPENSNIRDVLKGSLNITASNQELLHIQLQIESQIAQFVRIFDFPWELLCDERGFLVDGRAEFSRYIAHDIPAPCLPKNQKVNVLLISSKAYDMKNELGEIFSHESEQIRACLEPKETQTGKAKKDIHLDILPSATFKELGRYLTTHRGNAIPHVIHFDGHGFFGKHCRKCSNEVHRMSDDKCRSCGKGDFSDPQGYLLFEHEISRIEYISAERISAEIRSANFRRSANMQDHIALIVLSACRSAVSLFKDSVFNGVAQSLINAGIPTVVAMQFSVTVLGAAEFVERFYLALAEKDFLDMAMNSGRVAMGYDKQQWYRPVLYQRWQDDQGGQLFADSGPINRPEVGQFSNVREFNPGFRDSSSFFENITNLGKPMVEKLIESEEQKGKYILPKAHRAFFGTSIGPTPSERAKDELQKLKILIHPLAEFIDSDNASIVHLSLTEVQLRNNIRQPIQNSYSLLCSLEPLIEKFIPLSEGQSRDMIRTLQEIQTSLRELEGSLNVIKDNIDDHR
jgi:hypothetical protein